ncbi:MAG: dihydrolipoyl dehydrogenase [Bdellovibrio sp.]|nr:dihydrolipoyl dehydrogenase [Bdellovibrio sp.]
METHSYDLVVIGGGPAGYVGAIRAAQLGLKVACIEKRKTLGGTCLNVGCIPSKALLDSSEHYYHAKTKLGKHGIIVGDLKLDLAQMMKRKNAVVRQLTQGIVGLFKKNKIDFICGHGKLKEINSQEKLVEVENGTQLLKTPRILLATGSAPSDLSFLPFDGSQVISSTEALELNTLPKHLVVIGGGAIGLEMGSVWLRLGSKVTLVEFMDRIIPGMDQQMSLELQKILTRQGFEFRLSAKCLGAQKKKDIIIVEAEDMNSKTKFSLECDVVLVATGRKPYTDGLGLEVVGVQKDKDSRVIINERFETNIAGIYAVGDIVSGPMLAHKAEEEAVAAVEVMTGHAGHVNYGAIPNIVYTWPEVASVGHSEEELKTNGTEYKTGTFPFLANGRAKAMEETDGFVKILADAKTDRILGVHILGPRASDMIAEAVVAMEFGGSAEDLALTCHAHPTLSEAVKEAALAVDKRSIHI